MDITPPFFGTMVASGATRRLLLVSYAFPPDSSIGALRWEKMVVHAAQRGWSTDVLMIDPAQSWVRDDSRLTYLPPGIRLFGLRYRHQKSSMEAVLHKWAARVLQPLRSRGVAAGAATHRSRTTRVDVEAQPSRYVESGWPKWINPARLLLAVRRAQLARRSHAEWEDWAERAAATGIALAERHAYDLVISSGPPHMAHEAARQISEATSTPYAIDLRDPWAHEAHNDGADAQSPAWSQLSERYEKQAVAGASLVVMNTALAEQMMRQRYKEKSDSIISVMNGADPELRLPGRWGSTFLISYVGHIYGGRDPRLLFRGVRRAIDEVGIAPGELEVRFMGSETIGETALTSIANDSGLSGYFVSEPAQVRSAALALLQRSAMAVILPQRYRYSIPGKVFEYAQAHVWVLSLAERGSATDLMVRDSGADIVAPDDRDGIARVVAARYREFRAGLRPTPINADGRFDRSRQADKLFDAIDRVVEHRASSSSIEQRRVPSIVR